MQRINWEKVRRRGITWLIYSAAGALTMDIASGAALLVDGVTAERIVGGITAVLTIVGGSFFLSMHEEKIIQWLMSVSFSAGMTLTPAQVEELNNGALRLEAVRRLVALENPSPAQLTRIAELTVFTDGDQEAQVWWERAAAAGDEDAQDMLEILKAEEEA
jgi:hypothetical protein